jgi:hypothetical protein
MTEVISARNKSGLLFPVGQVLMTEAVTDFFEDKPGVALSWLKKHVKGDWGDISSDDAEVNQDALNTGSRLFSSYDLGSDSEESKLWIITESDRSVTTLLFPSDY